MFSEFLLQFLNSVDPLDRFGSLVVIGDELMERALEAFRTEKVIGMQVLALEHTEPDLDLFKPRGIGQQPEELKVQSPLTGAFLFAEPIGSQIGSVGGSIIENEGNYMDLPPQGFVNDLLLHKRLEINKALALTAGSVDFPSTLGYL